MEQKTVSVGVNALKCEHCEAGTVFVPVSMVLMAKIRHGNNHEYAGTCHLGHPNRFMLTARNLTMAGVEE